jgi:hypothetical protein
MNLDNPNILTNIIDKALLHYDSQTHKYNKYLETDNITVDRNTNKIIFTDIDTIEYKYEILGVFDNMTRIWLWAWMSPEFMFNETDIVRKLLNYGLKINRTIVNRVTDDRLYLKTQLVNSRFLLEDNFQLDIHLALSSYLAKDNFKFIYNKKLYLTKDKKKYITIYYLIK